MSAEATARARAQWPRVELDDARFIAWLDQRRDPALPVNEALAALHLPDLYLACACAHGNATALRLFDEQFLSQVPRLVAHVGKGIDVVEVQQQLRERLFCGDDPRIVHYSGRGPLLAWLRVAAVRTALNERRRRAQGVEERPLPAGLDDPELMLLEARYREPFRNAVRRALTQLEERDRVLLRLQVVEGVVLPRLAGMYAVDRATIVRWLARARQRVRALALEELRAHLGGSVDELHSVLRLLRSRLEVSLGALLRQP